MAALEVTVALTFTLQEVRYLADRVNYLIEQAEKEVRDLEADIAKGDKEKQEDRLRFLRTAKNHLKIQTGIRDKLSQKV